MSSSQPNRRTTFTVTLTASEWNATIDALGCPLGGDDDDALTVFGTHERIRAAKRAQTKLVRAQRGGGRGKGDDR